MSPYPMTDVIVQREYSFDSPTGPMKVVASLGKPAVMPDTPHGDWYCPYRVEGPDHDREFFAAGVDSVQALLLGISAIRAHLLSISRRGKLTWHGHEDLSLELIGSAD
jgi:hypothetical protein